MTGFIVQDTGGFAPALLFSASLGMVSGLVYLFIANSQYIDSMAFGVFDEPSGQ